MLARTILVLKLKHQFYSRKIQSFRYPHWVWAKEIKNLIQKYPELKNKEKIIDLPCGEAYIPIALRIMGINNHFCLVDNNPKLVESLKSSFALLSDFESINCTYENYRFEHSDSIWLFVNSILLIDDPTKIFLNNSVLPKFIILIVSDIDSKNYKEYKLKNNQPQLEWTNIQLNDLFDKHGYRIIESKKTTAFDFYFWFKIPILKYILNFFFIFLEPIWSRYSAGNYYIILFQYGNA